MPDALKQDYWRLLAEAALDSRVLNFQKPEQEEHEMEKHKAQSVGVLGDDADGSECRKATPMETVIHALNAKASRLEFEITRLGDKVGAYIAADQRRNLDFEADGGNSPDLSDASEIQNRLISVVNRLEYDINVFQALTDSIIN